MARASKPAAASPASLLRGPSVRKGASGLEVARATSSKNATGKASTKPSHQVGRPPKVPKPTLPAGTPQSTPNLAVRRAIAGSPIVDVAGSKVDDPELKALNQAEQSLFPRPLPGLRVGFDWDEHDTGATTSEPSHPSQHYRELFRPRTVSRLDDKVTTYLDFYRSSPEGRAIARAFARKVGRYEELILTELTRAGLPRELIWQSMVESGHNPGIRSSAGAAGLWQFMPETARIYGLTVDRWVDERLDPARATEAATKLLSDLHRRFGNWELALSAYNMGDAGLARSIQKYNTNDFWLLSEHEGGIPWETSLYVPKIFALMMVMENRAFFDLSDVAKDPPEKSETVLVGPGQSLLSVAVAAGVSEAEIERLNPQLLAGRTPPVLGGGRKSFRVRVPSGTGELVREKLGRGPSLEPDLVPTVTKQGDDVEAVALREGTNPELLRSLNRIERSERLEAGTVLLVPRTLVETRDTQTDQQVVVVMPNSTDIPGKRRVFYRAVPGDSLSSIARAFGVSRAELLAHNAIDPSARLQPDMVLQIFVETSHKLERVTYLEGSRTRVLVAGSTEFIEYHENLRGNQRLVITAKEGDTLAKIGARYGLSVGSMERINRRSRRDPVLPDERIVVYQKRTEAQTRGRSGQRSQDELPRPATAASPARGASVLSTGRP